MWRLFTVLTAAHYSLIQSTSSRPILNYFNIILPRSHLQRGLFPSDLGLTNRLLIACYVSFCHMCLDSIALVMSEEERTYSKIRKSNWNTRTNDVISHLTCHNLGADGSPPRQYITVRGSPVAKWANWSSVKPSTHDGTARIQTTRPTRFTLIECIRIKMAQVTL